MKIAFRSSVVWIAVFAMVLGLAVSSHVGAQVISGDLVGTVLDKTGAVTAQNNILAATRENLGPAALPRDARLAVAKAYQARLETLLNDPKIVTALQE